MSKLAHVKQAVSKFHNDERGLEALQTVMILAIAAGALVLVKNYWTDIKGFFKHGMDQATNKANFDSSK